MFAVPWNPLGCDYCCRGQDIITQAISSLGWVKTYKMTITFAKQTRDQRMSSAGEEDVFSLVSRKSLWDFRPGSYSSTMYTKYIYGLTGHIPINLWIKPDRVNSYRIIFHSLMKIQAIYIFFPIALSAAFQWEMQEAIKICCLIKILFKKARLWLAGLDPYSPSYQPYTVPCQEM